jgi:integrase
LNYLVHLEKMHVRHAQLRNINWVLTSLEKQADLNDTQKIDEYIGYLPQCDASKQKLTQVYAKYCEFAGIPYKRKKFKNAQSKPIKVPTEEKINMIAANAGKTLATKILLSKETGMRPVEVQDLKWKDIDIEKRLVYPTTAKGGNPRILKISLQIATMIHEHAIRYKLKPDDKLFRGTAEHYGTSFERTRNKLATRLNDPTLRTIRLYDLRHFFGTMLYHKTKDILLVKQQLGHRRIESTLVYIDLDATLYGVTDDYTCKAARNADEAMKLVESGFEYVTTIDDVQLFRKRK